MRGLIWIGLILAQAGWAAKPDPACLPFQKATASGPAAVRLKRWFDVTWEYSMREYPEWATFAGHPGYDDRWTDWSPEAIERRKKLQPCQLTALNQVHREALKGEDVVSFDLARRGLELEIEGQKFPSEVLVLDHMSGLHHDLPDTMDATPVSTKRNYEDRIARLDKVPVLEFQMEALMREGLKRKVTPVKMFVERVPAQIEKVLTANPEESPIFRPFKDIRAPISEKEKDDLRQRALTSLKKNVYPALQKLSDFVVDEYIPGARTSTAWKDLPDGAAWYAYQVKRQTTTSMKPEELHALGLREVERITAEMEKVKEQVKFKGSLAEFNRFLLNDSQFYFNDPAALMLAYRDLAKRIDPELPRLFKTLPRLTYGVREMPAYKAKEAPAAYYQPGSPEAGRAGYFEANTSDLKSRPKWGMEALTMHEAVPGHHLQIALAQELKDLPKLRRHGNFTAFVEGWGLYAESLGADLGFYKDPYSKYGQLTYEMWRAVRLVVDTGMHMLGWSREQAVDYFTAHMAKTRFEAEQEIDRYLTWPAQALAYKVGQLKFLELRESAKNALGDKFDVREFHDEVLKHGSLPMDVLEKSVHDWLAARKKELAKLKPGA